MEAQVSIPCSGQPHTCPCHLSNTCIVNDFLSTLRLITALPSMATSSESFLSSDTYLPHTGHVPRPYGPRAPPIHDPRFDSLHYVLRQLRTIKRLMTCFFSIPPLLIAPQALHSRTTWSCVLQCAQNIQFHVHSEQQAQMFLAVQIEGHNRVITSWRATWICQYSVFRVNYVVYKNSIRVENKFFFG
jgi:hypothetical protein